MTRAGAVLVLILSGPALAAQTGFEASYGRWWHDGPATTFAAGLYGPVLGPLSWSLGVTHLDDHLATPDDRTHTGAVVGLGLLRDGQGLYGTATAALAVRHGTSDLDAAWSAGAGYALRLFGPSLALEARYRWEDRALAGFWRLDPADRRGWVLEGRVSFTLGGRPAHGSPLTPPRISGNAPDVARNVVRTALDAMGTPYEWGGTDDNGFDCSGLIQYAYRAHGVILPRVSRDQMRQGIAVATDLAALRPGDLLGFAADGRGITHIGLYVGDGQFIHSASRGVVLTSLVGGDPDSAYWQRRWVSVRRIVE